MAQLQKTVLQPGDCSRLVPTLPGPYWVHRYTHPTHGWIFSIATHGEPHSGKLSLGGFRIAPESRTSIPNYSNDREAIELGCGMEEKVFWSRLINVGGPLGLNNLARIVGGKCVLQPTPDARVGQPRDIELLDFAVQCFADFEESTGVYLTTGQDLGHGTLSDGKTHSLTYVHDRFLGSVLSDTSKPTAEGNFYILRGMLRACGIDLAKARVGLIGVGNIGEHVLLRLREAGSSVFGLEAVESKVQKLAAEQIEMYRPADKARFLSMPMDALVVNANGGTLDTATMKAICNNPRIRVICGCENLVMPDPTGSELFRQAKKLYAPTEMGGMMGYLTAVEEYLSRVEERPFKTTDMFIPSRKLEEPGLRAGQHTLAANYSMTFEDAVRQVYSPVCAAAAS